MSYRVRAESTPLNFRPGTMEPAGPDDRLIAVSKNFDTREEAINKRTEWMAAVLYDGWNFTIEEES